MTIFDVPIDALPAEGEVAIVDIGSLTLESGAVIDDVSIAVQRWGELSPDRDNVVVESRGALRRVELSRFRLTLAERAVEINRKRLEEQQLKIDQVQPHQLGDLLVVLDDQHAALRRRHGAARGRAAGRRARGAP